MLTERIDIVKPLWWEKQTSTLNDTDFNYILLYLEDTYENTGVGDVTIRNCTFNECSSPVQTDCAFLPTEKAPYYHQNIRFTDNSVHAPMSAVIRLDNGFFINFGVSPS